MEANELRRAFTGFFAERGHIVVPSASLIPHDPTVMFTVAGMVPFKPYFLGEETPPYRRATSVQKVVRAGGKQNDLDEVGRTSRHLSFFEMLGNFSFGDYFKAEAIPWAWELCTDVLGLDPNRLWVTVHVSDDDAEAIWRDSVGVAAERIQRLDEDNFWRMGDTGPCGPCSEIFWDKGPGYGEGGGPAQGGEERYVEIWNLVFMQSEQKPDGDMVPLPQPSIDTGAGLERLLSVLQGVDSVFETDEFQPLIATASDLTDVPYGADAAKDISLRILAEHSRTMTFLVSDGVFPSNEDRGYVLRRVIRRAVRHAYLLGVDEVLTPAMVDAVVAVMSDAYPELAKNHEFVRKVVGREEASFRETLRTGSAILDEALRAVGRGERLPGTVAFVLHDTHGFPLEVTQEIAAERGLDVDVEGFEAEMERQRQRARADRQERARDEDQSVYADLAERFGPTEFTGREEYTSTGRVLLIAHDAVVLDRTPFYAESGGQVGDTGTISTESGVAEVLDTTFAVPGVHKHHIRVVEGEIFEGQEAVASIDGARRDAIRRNHTGTHILHWALRQVLGDHVKQQGSLVAPDRLRFDFSHYTSLSGEELAEVEDLANREILADHPVFHFETTRDHAEEIGAIAFFGDKYGEVVRVLEAGPHSTELCGGTHVRALGEIGPVKIVSEGSIGSNIRRLEAVSGFGPIERLREEESRSRAAADLLGVSKDDLVDGVHKRLAELKEVREELRQLRRDITSSQVEDLVGRAVNGVIVARVDVADRSELRELAVSLRDNPGVRGVVLGAVPGGKGVALVSAVTEESGLHASELISEATRMVRGGGGSDERLAVAGGKDVDQLDPALDQVRSAVEQA
ncbi:MAG: Alanine--tRNA ligase [Acidimicrobiales bacterium]|nr:MAG: alanine--tRNA ligase [Actinomycetota bacterium]MBV6507059.1 Alanine--tRNA ligase [Acidimicrobiales bacterium]RIK05632.1 MAG: alanine--tRNA ligase [Acidobacteriota bacterium]